MGCRCYLHWGPPPAQPPTPSPAPAPPPPPPVHHPGPCAESPLPTAAPPPPHRRRLCARRLLPSRFLHHHRCRLPCVARRPPSHLHHLPTVTCAGTSATLSSVPTAPTTIRPPCPGALRVRVWAPTFSPTSISFFKLPLFQTWITEESPR